MLGKISENSFLFLGQKDDKGNWIEGSGSRCIPNTGLITYKQKKYKCVGRHDTGINGCQYRCGDDAALRKNQGLVNKTININLNNPTANTLLEN